MNQTNIVIDETIILWSLLVTMFLLPAFIPIGAYAFAFSALFLQGEAKNNKKAWFFLSITILIVSKTILLISENEFISNSTDFTTYYNNYLTFLEPKSVNRNS